MRVSEYPEDEKRPPLFSAILSLYPEGVDPLIFGRLVMTVVSSLSILLFFLVAKRFIKSEKHLTLAILLFWLNPVYLYWSLRIYADVPFSLLVLFVFLLYYYFQESLTLPKSFLIGVITAVTVLLRFEGYLLLGALFAALTYGKKIKYFVSAFIGSSLVIIPYVLYRNTLDSTYLSEPSSRSYDLISVLIFMVSLFFSFGFIFAPAFFVLYRQKIWSFLKDNLFIAFFLLLSLFLILLWPAAIPRLFVGVIPFLIIMLVICLQELEQHPPKTLLAGGMLISLLMLYVCAQYYLKLQFLIVIKPLFVAVVIVNLLFILFYLRQKFLVAYTLMVVSMLLWSGGTLFVHKNIYKSISEASKYASRNFEGVVLHNDINSVAEWYLNYDPNRNKTLHGKYVNISDQSQIKYETLNELDADFVMISNEHDMSWQPELKDISYLEEVRVFRYNVNSGNFFTGLYLFKK